MGKIRHITARFAKTGKIDSEKPNQFVHRFEPTTLADVMHQLGLASDWLPACHGQSTPGLQGTASLEEQRPQEHSNEFHVLPALTEGLKPFTACPLANATQQNGAGLTKNNSSWLSTNRPSTQVL